MDTRRLGSLEVRTVGLGCAVLVALAAGCGSRARVIGPQTREFTVTAVPLLTKEMQRTYGFLAKDFAPGGVLEGKEVYAFEPSSMTVYEGDTLALTLINPEDDAHSFVLPNLSVTLPPQSRVSATYVARAAGTYRYLCAVPAHLPFMYGTLVVLPAPARHTE
jgi:plastocyanin